MCGSVFGYHASDRSLVLFESEGTALTFHLFFLLSSKIGMLCHGFPRLTKYMCMSFMLIEVLKSGTCNLFYKLLCTPPLKYSS